MNQSRIGGLSPALGQDQGRTPIHRVGLGHDLLHPSQYLRQVSGKFVPLFVQLIPKDCVVGIGIGIGNGNGSCQARRQLGVQDPECFLTLREFSSGLPGKRQFCK